jgi:hypothetical protein
MKKHVNLDTFGETYLMKFDTIIAAFDSIGSSFQLGPFGTILQPLLQETLTEHGMQKARKGTILTPVLMVWLVLTLTIRRDLNYHKALNWMVSGFRWISHIFPASSTFLKDGAVSHARIKLGVEVFHTLFTKVVGLFTMLKADFHGMVTVVFDGTTGTMPDTPSNTDKWSKPSSRKGAAAFPQVRIMTLMAVSVRGILDVTYAAYRGKKTGERALMRTILMRQIRSSRLFLLDAGLYAFDILHLIMHGGHDVIVKAPKTVILKSIQRLPDGSFLANVTGKLEDVTRPPTLTGRKHWREEQLLVRVIRVQIPGYRPFSLLTSVLNPAISAREIALHYHQRWDIEIVYDEIKTHQCATLRGHAPTTFRSKRADLVEQELYAMLIMYNLIRLLIVQAAVSHGKDPRFISFLDALQHIIDATPMMTADFDEQPEQTFAYLLLVIADAEIDRPRRHRINPRVVKIKMSKFTRKNSSHTSEKRDLEKDLRILEIQQE